LNTEHETVKIVQLHLLTTTRRTDSQKRCKYSI